LAARAALFEKALAEKGLASESEFLAARLSDEERESLAQRQDGLKAKAAQCESLIKDKTAELAKEEAKRLTQAPEAELRSAIQAAAQRLREIREEIGSVKEKLERDDKCRALSAEKSLKLAERKDRARRFGELNSLIGAADGKKFRNYAQTLTFEKLVQNANAQLRKISPRYLLRQDDKANLAFNVVDAYQGGLVRPIDNLSGGEIFLVSLALALGLSLMSSENVEVNSLFLDEGFGSLDEESLDLAISALADLPHSEGKTIGLISHVAGLERRVATQIRVRPQFGGNSSLSGPGCRQIGP
jgi:exonuclease SbcC